MAPLKFKRRELRSDDVKLQITYVGMCHSDVHQLRNEWGSSQYPMVPGHEILGVVTDVGADVTKFKMGDLAAVGCMVDSCGKCNHCQVSEEQYCTTGAIMTYNGTCASPFYLSNATWF
jgi:alcohol dehydrogenase (NADP+)